MAWLSALLETKINRGSGLKRQDTYLQSPTYHPSWEQLLDRKEFEEPGPRLLQTEGIGNRVPPLKV